MTADDERRWLADRLRGPFDVMGTGDGKVWLNGTLFGMSVCCGGESDLRNGMASLARMVEPICDRRALLLVADDLERDARDCGVLLAARLIRRAERIREACGVSDG